MASTFEDLIIEANKCNDIQHLSNKSAARSKLFTQWTTRLAGMGSLDDDSASKLHDALIGNGSQWSTKQASELDRLIDAINSRKTACGKRGRMQNALHFENLLSEADWAKLRRNILENAGIVLLAKRAASLNMKNVSEPTLFRMADILAYCMGTPQFDQTKKTSIKETLQVAIKSEHSRISTTYHTLPWLTDYPFSASELPTELIELAYGNDGPPVTVDIPELNVKNDAKMRPGRQSVPAWLKNVPIEHRHIFLKHKPQDTASPTTCSSTDQPHSPKVEHAPTTSPIQTMELPIDHTLFNKRARCPPQKDPVPIKHAKGVPIKIEITDSPVKQPNHADTADGDGLELDAAGTIEEMEKQLLLATKDRANKKVSKKPAARVNGAKKAEVVAKAVHKKPAAPHVLKKPAARITDAGAINMKDVFATLRGSRHSKTRGAFTTYAYKKGEQRMVAAGSTPEQAKDFARAMLKRASELWDKLA